MIIKLEVEINAPRQKVWELFTDYTLLPKWQTGLVEVSMEKGDYDKSAEVAEVYLLHYKINDETITVKETVSETLEPEQFQASYEHPRVPANIVSTSTFTELNSDTTLWTSENFIRFTRLDYRLFGRLMRPILRYQQSHDMIRFKQLAEN